MSEINDVLNDETWIERSLRADDLTPVFSFVLSRTVFVTDPNDSGKFRSGLYDLPLALPELGARDALRPTAREALGREAELAAYYLGLMKRTGGRPAQDGAGYWLRLTFVREAFDQAIEFPWWDRIADTSGLFDWIRASDAGDAGFFDCDQGWLFKAERRSGDLHFWEGDLDSGEVHENLKVDQAAFLARLEQAESDIRTVLSRLKERLQADPW